MVYFIYYYWNLWLYEIEMFFSLPTDKIYPYHHSMIFIIKGISVVGTHMAQMYIVHIRYNEVVFDLLGKYNIFTIFWI